MANGDLLGIGISMAILFTGLGLLIGAVLMNPKKKGLSVGDKVPDDILAVMADPAVPNGAFIEVCPACQRINNIWHP